MPLIVKGLLKRGFSQKGKHVGVYIEVRKDRLSEPYECSISSLYEVDGEILDIEKYWGPLVGDEVKIKELIGKSVKFILSPVSIGTYDFLYISEASWYLFRDYGVFPEEYVLKVKLTHIKIDEKVIEIFPKRNVEA